VTSTEVPRHPRAAALLLGGILTGILLASGSLGLWKLLAGPELLRTEAQEQIYRQPVTSIDIDLTYSSVTLTSGKPGIVTVRRQLTWSRAKPVPAEQVVGRTLQIRSDCPYVLLARPGQCRADLVVEVPPGAAVQVNLENGQVRAEELTGALRLTTVDGNITVSGTRGRLWARSHSGDVIGTDLGAVEADVRTRWSDVDLRFAVVPDLVRAATTELGNVSIAVPRAGTGVDGYQIRVGAGDGRQDVDVLQDSAGRHTIAANTDHGDINVRHTTGG
jgi:hypothetical protein